MKFLLSLPLLLIVSYPACSAGLDLKTASFDEILEADFTELLESANDPATEKAPLIAENSEVMDWPAVMPAMKSSPDETEIKRCPPDPRILTYRPDSDLFTYIGFKYVRSDGSTCLPEQSGGIYYQKTETQNLAFNSQPEGDASFYAYELETREYTIRRNFYFRTQLDGTRRFYAYETSQYTGRQVPETVQLEFINRAAYPLLPWEPAETFRLEYGIASGAMLTPVSTNYEYQISAAAGKTSQGNLLTKIGAAVLRKKELTPPEPDAVSLTLVKTDTGLAIDLRDLRAAYYQGEKTGLKIRLWRNVILLADKIAYDIEVGLEAASQIVMDFSDPRWDSFKKENLSPGREYYAEWSFSRLDSRISSGEWIDKGKSNRIKL
ncbi:MAG: hypothetical protein KKH28_03435 [Elusimicrobia bacterium]|nr:hypothetical protein [Elusimicrobiota bacterium]